MVSFKMENVCAMLVPVFLSSINLPEKWAVPMPDADVFFCDATLCLNAAAYT